jgi:hypothetical protein
MKATGQPWCIYPRNGIDGIFYVQLKNKETGNYMTAKSTGSRDRNEATRFASRWWTEYDKTGTVSYKPSNSMMDAADYQMKALDEKITAYTQTAIDTIVQSVQTVSFNKNTPQPYSISAAAYEDAPKEVKPILDQLSTLTFYDYILLYWNYKESPFIKGKIRTGATPPNPERFYHHTTCIKKYEQYFPSCLLTEITGTKIDTMLGAIKGAGKLKENTMHKYYSICIQALRFAYRNNLIARDISQQITRESKSTRKKAKKEAEKATFTKEEIRQLFNGEHNPFGSQINWLINEVLFKTGCRIGEIQALQMQDFIKNADGYALKIDKNYCRTGKRLKCTKTERSDIVPLPADLAEKLLVHLESNPCQDDPEAFIFSSPRDAHKPFCYESFNDDFNRTMRRLGMKRTNLTLHSYRHTFATFLRLAGFSEEELKFLTRHDCIAEVRHYADHYTPEMEQLKYKAVIALNKIIE